MCVVPSFDIISTLEVADAAIVVLFRPANEIAAGWVPPVIIPMHQATLDNGRCRIKMRLLERVVAREQGPDAVFINLVQIKLIRHVKARR